MKSFFKSDFVIAFLQALSVLVFMFLLSAIYLIGFYRGRETSTLGDLNLDRAVDTKDFSVMMNNWTDKNRTVEQCVYTEVPQY